MAVEKMLRYYAIVSPPFQRLSRFSLATDDRLTMARCSASTAGYWCWEVR
jgi:hypothetical protein